MTYQVTLIAKEEVAERTFAFHFSKPDGFVFKPGQAIDLILPDSKGDKPTHTFSLVSAPYENELVIATRMRNSRYKKALAALPIGTALTLDGPFGSLTLSQTSSRPAVLVAGGIGITPFISMVKQATHDHATRELVLIYSNRRPEDAPFLHELQRLQDDNINFRLLATMTRIQESRLGWDGTTGLIDAALIKTAIHLFDKPPFYLAGPPKMVDGIRKVLEQAGIDADDIRDEGFFGY